MFLSANAFYDALNHVMAAAIGTFLTLLASVTSLTTVSKGYT